MAQQLSKASLVIRVVLILVLVALIGAFVIDRRAGGQAEAAFNKAKELVANKKNSAELQQALGRKPNYDGTQQTVREQWYTYQGVIHDYTVVVRFNLLDGGEAGEEADLNVYNKIKGKREGNADEGLK